MKVVLFGTTGMIGQGVLRECLAAPDVTEVVSVVRTPGGQHHPKLREVAHRDFLDLSTVEPELAGCDACFYCLGVSSTGMAEADYTRITVDMPVAAARAVGPGPAFVYVSGAGSDPTEASRTMWRRVKGRAERLLLDLGPRSFVFRPGYIQPLHGITSRTRLYRALYAVTTPFYPVLRRLFPGSVTTTELVGRAMLNVARRGAPVRVLEMRDINTAAENVAAT